MPFKVLTKMAKNVFLEKNPWEFGVAKRGRNKNKRRWPKKGHKSIG